MSWDPTALPGPFAAIGNTPLVPVRLGEVRLLLKLEGLNPSGSVKDRAAASMLRHKILTRELRPGQVLLDASSGNMAGALACCGRALGLDVHVVCNATITADKRRFIEYFGATLIENDFGPYTYDGYRKCRELVARDGDSYCFLDQLHNPLNPYAHEQGTGPEILRDLPSVRLIIGSLGSGGTMLGIGRAVRAAGHGALVAAVASAPGNRMAGVGAFADGDYRTPFIAEAEREGLFAETCLVTVETALRWQRAVLAQGIFCGAQTGAVVAAAMDLASRYGLRDGVVAVSGDAGWKSWND
jgi:[CysO sulfur-carrier protein]-thiocarboxylate-dependent cysteine synthase